jgi:hypothetical protein
MRISFIEYLKAIAEDSGATSSLISAIIAAAVAIIVVAVNATIARRQQRVQFLQPKLEELYLLLNEVAERNTRLFKLLAAVVEGDIGAKKHLEELDDLEVYGHLTAKKIIMLVRLYFPKLTRIHQLLFSAERKLSQKVWSLSMSEPIEMEELLEASGRVGHMLRLMEQEMVENQRFLLKATTVPRFYRQASEDEVLDVPPPPSGPPLSKTR